MVIKYTFFHQFHFLFLWFWFDGNTVLMLNRDTSGENEYDRYRPLSYSKADVFLMCFSLIDKNSLENIKLKVCVTISISYK